MLNSEVKSRLAKLWNSCPPQPSSNVIFVDLMHGHTEFLLRTLMIAKAVQSFTGSRLFGLVGSPGVVTRSTVVDATANEQLAKAFQLDGILPVPTNLPAVARNSISDDIDRIASSSAPGHELSVEARNELAKLKLDDGFPIGRIISETFLRSELVATVRGGDRLIHWAEHVQSLDEWFIKLIDQHDPDAFITGHVDYCPWGHLTDRMARLGKRTVYFRCDARVPINIIDTLDPDETPNGRIRISDTSAFAKFEAEINRDAAVHAVWLARADSRARAVREGLARNWRWTKDQSDNGWRLPFTKELPTYIVFAHTFTDQPLADEALFVDHAHWLEATLQDAACSKAYNLVVKLHPYDESFDLSGTGSRLIERFSGHSNIQITRQHIEQDVIAKSFDAGITVRGTPGIEMACLGLPVILAGRGSYSDIGFCITPATQAEYFNILRMGPNFQIDMDIQTQRAKLYFAFDRFWSAPSSELIPPFTARSNDTIFDGMESAFQSVALETDSICLALRRAWPLADAKVVATELTTAIVCTNEGIYRD